MGVEYSTSLAYGKEIDEKYLRENISGFTLDPWDSLYDYFKNNYPLLEVLDAGNNWGGEVAWAIVIKSTVIDVSQESGVFEFKKPSYEERLQFSRAYDRLADAWPKAEPIVIGRIF